jgi:hypothetical protein
VRSPQQAPFRLHYQDLRGQPQRQEKARQLALEQARLPFSLQEGPLLRALLLQVEDEQYVFLLTLHHIISDGWSMQVLVREVLALYQAHRHGQADPLPPLSIHYKDYAHWQHEQLSGETYQQHRRYWLAQLEGPLPLLELPLERARPPVKTYRGASCQVSLSLPLSKQLQAMARSQGASPFMVLLASVKALLYRYSGQEDIVVGSPIAGRQHADLEGQIGFFVNTLALRTRLEGQDSFVQLLGKVRQTVLDGFTHGLYPFDQLVEELHLERDLSRSPLFDVGFTWDDGANEPGDEAGFSITPIQLPQEHSQADLWFFGHWQSPGIVFTLVYNSDLFSEQFVESLAEDFVALLEEVTGDPAVQVNELMLTSQKALSQADVPAMDGFFSLDLS